MPTTTERAANLTLGGKRDSNLSPRQPVEAARRFDSGDAGGVLSIIQSPPELRAKALWTIFSQLSRSERLDHSAALLAAASRRVIALDHLLVACRRERLTGAALAIVGAGRAAHVWPCRLLGEEPAATASQLMQAQERQLAAAGVAFVQAFISLQDCQDEALLQAHGHRVVGDLVWMSCRRDDYAGKADRQLASPLLDFEPFDGDLARLSRMVDRTYVGTLDCPAMNDLRSTADVIDGYRDSPGFRADRWWIAIHRGEAVGCLLLADQSDNDQTELVYCGVTPEARGRGFGEAMTRYAQAISAGDGRARMVLSVDAGNRPALAIYAAAGFRAYDRRRVMAKKLG